MRKLQSKAIAIADQASTVTLALLASLHLLVLAITFTLILIAQGHAAEAASGPNCGGNDLLAEMATSDPALLAEINAEAAKVPFGDSLLYKLEKEGQKTSYLFGTMHLTDPRVVELPKAAQDALDQSEVVAIESTEILDPTKAQMTLLSKPELTMFTDEDRLSNYLAEDEKEVLAQGLKERGLQLALIDRMKPWILMGMLALPQCEFERKQAGEAFLDLALAKDAEQKGKELVGLETIVEQLDAMASLPMEFHVRGLVDTVALGDVMDDVIETMIVLYTEGKTATVWPMLRITSEQYGSASPEAAAGYTTFEKTMVNARNVTMFERSLPILEANGAFIAVGALHLPGEKGLAQLYKNAGYTVTPLQ